MPLPEVTQLLAGASAGDAHSTGLLLEVLFDELRGVAKRQLRGQRANHTLQATALVHEAWMRLAGNDLERARDRNDFLRFAARAMRSVLVDYARRRNARKRGDGEAIVALEEELAVWNESNVDVLDLNECLLRLEAKDEQLARIVELRFFAGLSEVETSEALGLTRRQIQHAWTLARAWLHRELAGFEEPSVA